MGTGGTRDVGVDFDEETVEEEIVIALPDEGGMTGLGAGVGGGCCGAAAGFEGRGFDVDSVFVEGFELSGGGGLVEGMTISS